MFSYSNWSVLTVNFLVVLYLALGGVTLSAVLYLVGARWRYEIRLLASSLFALFPLAFVLLVVLLVNLPLLLLLPPPQAARNRALAPAPPVTSAVRRLICRRSQ